MARMNDTPETNAARAVVVEKARALVAAADRLGHEGPLLDFALIDLRDAQQALTRAWEAAYRAAPLGYSFSYQDYRRDPPR